VLICLKLTVSQPYGCLRQAFLTSDSAKVLFERFRSDYGTSIGFYEPDGSLYVSYPSISFAALNLKSDRKYIKNCLNTGKLFRKRWLVRYLPSSNSSDL